MIVILGGSGYVGSEFAKTLQLLDIPFRTVSRSEVDYTNRSSLEALLRDAKSTFLINAAGYTGKPNVDACEVNKAACLQGNAVLPAIIADVCEAAGVPWGHVSSGCIYTGCKENGDGFTEIDTPNFCFRKNNCSFYSGCKAIGEECLIGRDNVFIWRLRIPFNNINGPRNYISKLLTYPRLLNATNSVSHLGEFVMACIQAWTRRVPFGTYNVVNTGTTTAEEVVQSAKRILRLDRNFEFFASEADFMANAAKTPRSNCSLDNSKLLSTGISMTPVHEAIEQSLKTWQV